MTYIFLFCLFIYTVLLLLSNIFTYHKFKGLLYVIIPVQLFLALFAINILAEYRGFATKDVQELTTENGFTYINHYRYGESVYLIALTVFHDDPRTYEINMSQQGTSNESDKARKLLKMMSELNNAKEKSEQRFIINGKFDSLNSKFEIVEPKKLQEIAPKG